MRLFTFPQIICAHFGDENLAGSVKLAIHCTYFFIWPQKLDKWRNTPSLPGRGILPVGTAAVRIH